LIAFLQAAFGYLLADGQGWWWLVDGVAYALLGLLLRKLKSRAVAIGMLVLSSIAVISTLLNILGVRSVGGSNLVLALLIWWTSVLAIRATVLLHKMKTQSPFTSTPAPANPVRASE
jgi:hypothetical protein